MSLRFAGYAALFGKRDDGRDVIRKGAFVRTLDERQQPLPLFWQHRPEMRIGWVERIAEDATGLRVIASIDNPDGGAAAALKQGTTNGLSFGYRARGYLRDAAGRELTDIDLYEVSLVSHPMQHAARVHLVERCVEQKINFRHYRENGQFARAGEGVLYGGGTARSGSASHSRQSRPASANSHLAISNGTSDDTSMPQRDIVVIGDRDRQLRDDFDATFSSSNQRRSSANSKPRADGRSSLRPIPNHQFGDLSAKEESGPRPMPGIVSTGQGDAGGVSYGPWQLATNRRQPQAFLASLEGQPWARRFAGKVPGSADFTRTWKEIAQLDGNAFFHAQRRYIGRSHYEVALDTIKNDTGLDLSQHGGTMQDVIWSRSVQLGPNTGAFKRVVDLIARQLPGVDRDSFEWSSHFVRNIYAESGRRNSEGAMVYFTRSPTLWGSLSKRFYREERAAQAQISFEWGRE